MSLMTRSIRQGNPDQSVNVRSLRPASVGFLVLVSDFVRFVWPLVGLRSLETTLQFTTDVVGRVEATHFTMKQVSSHLTECVLSRSGYANIASVYRCSRASFSAVRAPARIPVIA